MYRTNLWNHSLLDRMRVRLLPLGTVVGLHWIIAWPVELNHCMDKNIKSFCLFIVMCFFMSHKKSLRQEIGARERKQRMSTMERCFYWWFFHTTPSFSKDTSSSPPPPIAEIRNPLHEPSIEDIYGEKTEIIIDNGGLRESIY